ncbi:MAG: SUMF1/EgtB/PvdO family nonheme iron enzyme, partial [Cyanobacteriota bacterium]|nr:SUMF1/EgtB/PvdO family nonheme iron enzyme [Cyanobacteriota bacterium]
MNSTKMSMVNFESLVNYKNYAQKLLSFFSIFILAVAIFCPNAIASACPENMVFIPEGQFNMGSKQPEFIEEQTVEDVSVSSFCIDAYEITNAEFAKFVEDTGYVSVAERPLSKEQFPNLADEQRAPGSLVFQPPAEGIQQVAYLSWWHWVPGANWQHPYGSQSNITGKENHPVVHIAYEDAVAYAEWAGKQLPTE